MSKSCMLGPTEPGGIYAAPALSVGAGYRPVPLRWHASADYVSKALRTPWPNQGYKSLSLP